MTLVVLVAVAQALGASWREERRWAALRERGTLRVGIDPSIVPVSFFDAAGEWAGFDADVARAIARLLELTVQPVPVGYDGFYDALLADRVDVSLSALTPEARGEGFAYSAPYFDDGPRLLGAPPNSLAGKTLAVALGGEADHLARHLERRTAHLRLLTFNEEAEAVAAWRAGQAQAALVSAEMALALGCPALARPNARDCASLRPVPWVIALRREDGRLREAINRAIETLQQDGALDRLAERWLSQRVSPSP